MPATTLDAVSITRVRASRTGHTCGESSESLHSTRAASPLAARVSGHISPIGSRFSPGQRSITRLGVTDLLYSPHYNESVPDLGRWPLAPLQWVSAHPGVMAWIVGLSLLLFAGSLVAIPVLVARMRHDYFVAADRSEHGWLGRHPAARFTVRVIKNALGGVLFVAGSAMMVLPGQGIITLLVALSLLDFPGKRGFEIRLIRQSHINRTINWIRQRSGRPPLIIPER